MSIKNKLTFITLIFSSVIIFLMAINSIALETLSTVRAHVNSEGQWSKGQKDAFYFLARYTTTHREEEYQKFRKNLEITFIYKKARLELLKKSPDLALVDAALLAVNNHPDDVRPMGVIFKRFNWLDYFQKALNIWTEADDKIEKLELITNEIHQLVLTNKFTPELSTNYLAQIDTLNKELTELEVQYSFQMGEAARWITSVLFWVTLTLSILCLTLALFATRAIRKKILNSIDALKLGTIRAEQGLLSVPIQTNSSLNSHDELDQLAVSFNKMTESLNKAIVERDNALEKLELRARELSEVQELAHIGSWEWDIDKQVIIASQEYCRIFGYNPTESHLTFEQLIKRVHPADQTIVKTTFNNIFVEKKSFTIDYKLLMENGEIRELTVQGRVALDDNGEIIRIVGSSQDITERIKIQSQMIQSSKMASLGEMASGIAHEINNPLTIIKLAASQLQKNIDSKGPDLAGSITSISRIDSTVDRISKIILGLRTFSRDGKNDPVELVSVDEMLEDMLSFCNERLKHHAIKLIKNNILPDLLFEGRKIEITQVLLNLLNNSIDAIEFADHKWIKISVLNDDQYLEIKVTDSGLGIPLELQNKIFQPFFTSKEIGKGTGLGLSLSQTIMQNHQGELFIDLKSQNTCFVLRLPKKQSNIRPLA